MTTTPIFDQLRAEYASAELRAHARQTLERLQLDRRVLSWRDAWAAERGQL